MPVKPTKLRAKHITYETEIREYNRNAICVFLAPPKFIFFKCSEPETTKPSLLSTVCEGFSRRMFFKRSNDFIPFLFTDHSDFAPSPSNNPPAQ